MAGVGDEEPWRPRVEDGDRAIVRLSEDVVNKIAAGEVVQRPANAVKELLENSLDAGADRVEVTAVGGGLTVLRIEDNGHGIRQDDFPLLCERFATSKLKKFDDLKSIGTYGFRGEALASLSMVCRIEVTTRRVDSSETYTAKYREGQHKSTTRIPAGLNTHGTIIKATDMFYSMPQRRAMFTKPNEEYRLIADVLSKYSIMYPRCSFACKKTASGMPDLSAMKSSNRVQAIKQIYGKDVADSLLEVTSRDEGLQYRADVYFTRLSYFAPKMEVVIFINGRLVNHDGVTRMLKGLYQPLLPRQAHPFVFLDVSVNPNDIDVNAHPTKEKVIFLNEDDIISHIEAEITPVLERSLDASGSLHLKRKLSEAEGSFGVKRAATTTKKPDPTAPSQPTQYAHELVRTDHRLDQGALDRFLTKNGEASVKISKTDAWWRDDPDRLTVVQCKLDELAAAHDSELREALSTYSYVGWVNARHTLLQLDLGLYLVDSCVVSAELFYQLCLASLGEVTRLRFSLPLVDLLEAVTDNPAYALSCLAANAPLLSAYFAIDITATHITSLPNLLDGYTPPMSRLPLFLLRLAQCVNWATEACVLEVAEELANFYMLDDGVQVPVEEVDKQPRAEPAAVQEKKTEPAASAAPNPTSGHIAIPDIDCDSDGSEDHVPLAVRTKTLQADAQPEEEGAKPASAVKKSPAWVSQHVLYPAVKRSLLPPVSWRGTVLKKVADLPTMYKIFERC